MKHLLNNLSEDEKNRIREQHSGGMKVVNENFSKLINSKIGDVKPLVMEQDGDAGRIPSPELVKELMGKGFVATSDKNIFKNKNNAYVSVYKNSVASVCFDPNIPGGRESFGFNDVNSAISKAEQLAKEPRCKKTFK